MSIGAAFNNWPESPEAEAADSLVEPGWSSRRRSATAVRTAASSGRRALPGVAKRVIAAASFDNTKMTGPAFAVSPDGKLFPLHPLRDSPRPRRPPAAAELVTTINVGCNPIESRRRSSGRIALIRRGTCGFYVKAANAQAKARSGSC